MKSDCAVCYVTDQGFLFPTIASCLSMRKFWSPEQGDIFVFLIDADPSQIDALTTRFRDYEISFCTIDSRVYDRFDESNWNKTHVPKSALGRFLIGDLLPTRFLRLLYLDGDTLIVRDPSALLSYDPEENYIAAVEDITAFCAEDLGAYGRFTRTYLRGIGIKKEAGYFNSGVFLVRTETWRQFSKRSLDYFLQHPEACLFHDQSAMNAVLQPMRKRLSLAWNFQTPFKYLGVEDTIRPAIYHFTQSPKPWCGRISPWRNFYSQYVAFSKLLVDCNFDLQPASAKLIGRANQQSRLQKLKLNTIYRSRLVRRRNEISSLENSSILSESTMR